MPHPLPSLLWMPWVATPCQSFLGHLDTCLQVGSTEGDWRAGRREREAGAFLPSLSASGTVSREAASLSLVLPLRPQFPQADLHASRFCWRPSSSFHPSNPRVGSSFPQWQFLRFPCLLVVLNTFINACHTLVQLNHLAWLLQAGKILSEKGSYAGDFNSWKASKRVTGLPDSNIFHTSASGVRATTVTRKAGESQWRCYFQEFQRTRNWGFRFPSGPWWYQLAKLSNSILLCDLDNLILLISHKVVIQR